MDYDFKKNLNSNEEIVEIIKPVKNGFDRSIGGELSIIGFTLLCLVILIFSLVFEIGDGADGIDPGYIIIMLTVLFFLLLCIYSAINKRFIKGKKVLNYIYCLTNCRVISYDIKKDKLMSCYYHDIDIIETSNCRGKKGDLILQKDFGNDSKGYVSQMFNQDDYHRISLVIYSIENPGRIKNKIIELKNS